MIDEQRFRARLAALDAALRMHEDPGEAMTLVRAERIEEWLMDSDRESAPAAPPAVHNAAAVADRLGYLLCDKSWRSEDSATHYCCLHTVHDDVHPPLPHRCTCGALFTDMTP